MKNLVKHARYRLVSRLGCMALFVKQSASKVHVGAYSFIIAVKTSKLVLHVTRTQMTELVSRLLIKTTGPSASNSLLWFRALSFHMCLT